MTLSLRPKTAFAVRLAKETIPEDSILRDNLPTRREIAPSFLNPFEVPSEEASLFPQTRRANIPPQRRSYTLMHSLSNAEMMRLFFKAPTKRPQILFGMLVFEAFFKISALSFFMSLPYHYTIQHGKFQQYFINLRNCGLIGMVCQGFYSYMPGCNLTNMLTFLL
jgi:hypothetical protein